ncbi:MAG: hypothetical protein Unbinned4162contig1001_10 [Prokaryotic dsDNA virus sp.]|nr:MAG: hypothetical protein Unbinned4162contig1001_10 [Prokaryotic dsDNA virus sp.]
MPNSSNNQFIHSQSYSEVQESMAASGVIRTCENCAHCDKPNDQCGKFKAKPPIVVIAKGCEHWELDIPF